MTKYIIYAMIAVSVIAIAVYSINAWIAAERDAAVMAERKERLADAVELIRATDKLLGVQRKATNAELCQGMGGTSEECK
jgi:hypothetical protein